QIKRGRWTKSFGQRDKSMNAAVVSWYRAVSQLRGNNDDIDAMDPEMGVRCSCGLCMETYDEITHIPRVLNCGHSTCQNCIIKLLRGTKNVVCPACQTISPVNDVTSLPVNRSLIDVVDFVREELRTGQRVHVCSQCKK
ncbi:hypothetical protein PFISCL1PPCAC_222, partial [Pristionchus fissidentatus]